MPFDVSSILLPADDAPIGAMLPLRQDGAPRTPETVGGEIRYLSHQAKSMTLWFGIQIGQRLAEAKEMVGHGGWLAFLASETEFSQSAASRFIRLAREYGANQSTLTNLSVSNALRLLAVPEDEREEFAAAVDAGNLSARELEQAIRERDAARTMLREEQHRSAELRKETAAQADQIRSLARQPIAATQATDPSAVTQAVCDALAALESQAQPAAASADADAVAMDLLMQTTREVYNRLCGHLHKLAARDPAAAAASIAATRKLLADMGNALPSA